MQAKTKQHTRGKRPLATRDWLQRGRRLSRKLDGAARLPEAHLAVVAVVCLARLIAEQPRRGGQALHGDEA